MAAGNLDDPLSDIPNVVLVDQSAATAAPGAGYVRVEAVDGVLGIRVGTGAWAPLVSLVAGLLTALTEKGTPADTDLLLLQDEADASALKKVQVQNLPGGGGGALTTASNSLASDVTMVTQNQWYDGPSLELAAGTWLLTAHITVTNGTGDASLGIKLWDGSTVAASTHLSYGGSWNGTAAVSAIVTLAETATWKVSAVSTTANNTMRHDIGVGGSPHEASSLHAVKVA